jgi:hypothetical protein
VFAARGTVNAIFAADENGLQTYIDFFIDS